MRSPSDCSGNDTAPLFRLPGAPSQVRITSINAQELLRSSDKNPKPNLQTQLLLNMPNNLPPTHNAIDNLTARAYWEGRPIPAHPNVMEKDRGSKSRGIGVVS